MEDTVSTEIMAYMEEFETFWSTLGKDLGEAPRRCNAGCSRLARTPCRAHNVDWPR